ncbi:hypothetical protein ACFL4Y_01055 [Gemmatimonadota bacterium]
MTDSLVLLYLAGMPRGPLESPPRTLEPWLRADRAPPSPDGLSELGFLQPPVAAATIARLGEGRHAAFWREAAVASAEALRSSPDPDLALVVLERLSEQSPEFELLRDRAVLTRAAFVAGASRFLGDQLVRRPGLFRWLMTEGGLERSASEMPGPTALPPSPAPPAPETWLVELNRAKRARQLHLGARRVLGLTDVTEEFAVLSDLADQIVDLLIEAYWPAGLPRPTVIAMGKLGGRELNFSSDIDLIFAVPLDEDIPAAQVLPAAARAAEELVGTLTRYTEEGSLYRVDLRLRPGGDHAPLVQSIRGMETYYASQGAPWERRMLVKARVCAGDRDAGSDLLRRLDPFIFPTHAGSDPREEAHRHRRERRAREGASLSTENVKLAAGGIRDVEFIVEVLQLLYGGRRPGVRGRGALEAIQRLNQEEVLPDRESEGLKEAYRFFRALEHFIQMDEDRQLFTVPSDPGRRRAVSRLMGFGTATELIQRYDDHRMRVETTLRTMLPGHGEEESGEPLETILNLTAGGEEAARRLRRRGFRTPAHTHRVLAVTAGVARAEGANAWAAFVGLLPPLLEDAVATGAPDRAVNNLERVLRRLGSMGAYTRLLAKEPPLRRALLALCASGEMLTDLLVRHPEHFERLFSMPAARTASDRSGWRRRLRKERAGASDPSSLARRLESLRTREQLATGLAYAVGDHSLDDTMRDLGDLARDLIRCFMGLHLRDRLRPAEVGVLAMGTLASGSMTFASDADLLFVHAQGAGPRVQPLASRAAGLLSPPGGPYPVDMRLRPEGRSAPTSVDATYLQSYLIERASAWEALAMARIRPLYGRRGLLLPALEIVEKWLEAFALDDRARTALRAVRRSQEEELASGGRDPTSFFDVKRSPGAMADIEFLAIGLFLDSWKRGQPRHAHVPDMLAELGRAGKLAAGEAEDLRGFYNRCREAQVGLQLHYGRDVTRFPSHWGDVEPSASVAGESAAALWREAQEIRRVFDREFPPQNQAARARSV